MPMFPTNSIRSDEANEPVVYIDSFTSLIQREVHHNVRLLRQKNKALVLKKSTPSFSKEISCMMHAFGDVENPLPDSVQLVEKILRNQMNLLLEKASQVSFSQGKTTITHEEFLYLLRRKKDKLQRLFQYLNARDANEYISKKMYHHVSGVINGRGKRIKICLGYLNKIKGFKEFNHILNKSFADPLISRRMKMRYFKTLEMDDDQYLEYSQKLRVSFLPAGGDQRFKDWLLAESPRYLALSELALEIISYLARETVAELVESSMSVQQNSYLPDSSDQRLNTGDFQVSHPNKVCHTAQGTSASNSSVFSDLNTDFMDSTSSDCINCFMDHSYVENRKSILPNSNSKASDDCSDVAGVHRLTSPKRSSKVFALEDTRNVPLYPTSIREVMSRSTMSPNHLNTRGRRKLKSRIFCI